MNWVAGLKRLPIDLGQGNLATTTKGKLIAQSLVPDGAGGRALDVGCRDGHYSEWLKGRGYAVESLDIEPRYAGARRYDANDPLPFPDGAFDLVWCSEVIEHLRNPAAAIAEFKRVLRSGGTLIVTTPNSRLWIYRPIRWLTGKTVKDIQNPGHLHFFSIGDIRSLFPTAKVWGYFPYWLLRMKISRGLRWLTPTFVILDGKA
jgi:SAM-dependent methyltransferase